MKKKIQVLGLCSALVVSSAQAEIVFNGFANIVAGQTTSSDETLYGYDDSLDFNNGSLLALQATSELGEGFGITAQIIARGNNEWTPEFEWAYLSYDATDELRFLVGRQRVPFYMYSDFLDVSYAYPWITPPDGLYTSVFDSFDGLGAVYATSLGEFDTTFHFIYGGNNDDLKELDDAPTNFDDLIGLSVTVNRDWLTLRAGYFQTDMTFDYADPMDSPFYSLNAGWNSVGRPDIASNFLVEEDAAAFVEVGFQIDYENIIVVGEYTQLTLDDTPFGDSDNYYVMAGYRFDTVLFHVTYGGGEGSKDLDMTGVPAVPTGSPQYDGLIGGTNLYVKGQTEEETYYTAGIRWDFHESVALKFEYTAYSDDINSTQDSGLFRTAIVTVF